MADIYTRMKATAADPKFAPDQIVSYVDRQGRRQTGKVRSISAHWNFGKYVPLLIYTIEHPTYRNNQYHCGEEAIIG